MVLGTGMVMGFEIFLYIYQFPALWFLLAKTVAGSSPFTKRV
jgi:hypothetical protein